MANFKCNRGFLSADHSSPTSTEVKNEWPCTLTALVCLHRMDPFQLELGVCPDGMRKTPSLLSLR